MTDELARALERVAQVRPLVVALDFDGTLAPLVDDPSTSAMVDGAQELLADLTAAGVAVALVSGRAMNDLHALAPVPPGSFLVGSHGAERARVTQHGLDRDVVALTAAQSDALAGLGAAAAEIARGREGVWVETKPTAVVVHTRLASDADATAAEDDAVALGERAGAGVLHGHDVVEISVLHASKGEAITALRDELDAPVVVFAGDDVTDEHAFEALGDDDVTIKVGRSPTRAAFRVADPAALVGALRALLPR